MTAGPYRTETQVPRASASRPSRSYPRPRPGCSAVPAAAAVRGAYPGWMTAPLVAALNDCKALPVTRRRPSAARSERSARCCGPPPGRMLAEDRGAASSGHGVVPGAVRAVPRRDRGRPDVLALPPGRLLAPTPRLAGLRWSDLDLATRRMHDPGDVKSEDSERTIPIDPGTAAVLEAWRERQLFEALEGVTDGRTPAVRSPAKMAPPLRPAAISAPSGVLARRAGLPPVRLHDLRHGTPALRRSVNLRS